MRRVLMPALAVFLCLMLPINALSFETYSINTSPAMPSPLETINAYSGDHDTIYTISQQLPLLSFSGSEDYTFYALHPYGYAILLNSTNGLLEACYSKNAIYPLDVESNRSYYYGGPGVYCTFQDNTLVNLRTGMALDADMIDSAISLEKNMKAYETQKAAILRKNSGNRSEKAVSTTSTTHVYNASYSYFSQLSDYGYNEDGTCTVIAVQMLLGYYDQFINNSFVDTAYEQGVGTSEAFHQLLIDYVYGSSAPIGIKIRKAAANINQYLTDQGLNCELKSEYSSQSSAIDKAITLIRDGTPVIASMAETYSALYNHSVLIYRVTLDPNNPVDTAVFTMNMGWHSGTSDGQSRMEYVASASWFYECGYIESTCTSHRLSPWNNIDSISHQRNCIFCNYYESGLHTDSWDSQLSRCTKCGRTGSAGGIIN